VNTATRILKAAVLQAMVILAARLFDLAAKRLKKRHR